MGDSTKSVVSGGERDTAVKAAAVSMSESLAKGLVKSLTNDAREKQDVALARYKMSARPTVKRAAAYRNIRQVIKDTIPRSLVAFEYETDHTGKDKTGMYAVGHWDSMAGSKDYVQEAGPVEENLELMLSVVHARDCRVDFAVMCMVTNHALMRLFYRLKTSDRSRVLEELNEMALSLMHLADIARRMSERCELLLPTRAGAFVLTKDKYGDSRFAVKTWMSDARMTDNMRRLQAVRVARSELGVVVNQTDGFPVVSHGRLKEMCEPQRYKTLADALNYVADQGYDMSSRLPWDWRFEEPKSKQSKQLQSEESEDVRRSGRSIS